jgi:hypothetical protein
MSGHEAQLLARTEELDETSELAGQVIGILGGARAARLDPDALAGLIGAAIALGGSQAAICGTRTGLHFPSEREFTRAVVDAEDAIAEWLATARRTLATARAALMAACAALAAARASLLAARAALAAARARPATTKEQRAARDAAIASAQRRVAEAEERVAEAERRLALCEEALDILGPLTDRLAYALRRIQNVPSDVGETYECVYRLLRRGGRMPSDGDWVTGEGLG